MKFNSQICTSIEQSKCLLELGLKKETANCYLFEYEKEKYKVIAESWLDLIADKKYYSQYEDVCFPAWSLYRLLKMITTKRKVMLVRIGDDLFDTLIEKIRRLITDGAFNKEYLEERAWK